LALIIELQNFLPIKRLLTWGFMQVGLDKLSFSQLQSQALVQAGQTMLSISFNFIIIFSINSGPGGRNPNTTPAQSPVR
jgi:hypothetical protein